MTEKSPSLWTRLVRVFRPEVETYDTRRAGGRDPEELSPQLYQATDGRRHGGTGAIGGH